MLNAARLRAKSQSNTPILPSYGSSSRQKSAKDCAPAAPRVTLTIASHCLVTIYPNLCGTSIAILVSRMSERRLVCLSSIDKNQGGYDAERDILDGM
jgi:hypothetical protein